jgi:hypothetical protein
VNYKVVDDLHIYYIVKYHDFNTNDLRDMVFLRPVSMVFHQSFMDIKYADSALY